MNKHEYDIGYTSIESYYMAKANPTRYDLWWEKMKQLPATAFLKACDLWIEEGRYFPTLGQIKRMAYDCRTPAEVSASEPEGHVFSEAETLLGKDLFPMFMDYMNKKTTKAEWIEQMQYFADKHGLGTEMRNAIQGEVS